MFPAVAAWAALALSPSPPAEVAGAAPAAAARALPLPVAAAAGHGGQKTCSACHNQALPVMAFAAARGRGFDVPADALTDQTEHVAAFLAENRAKFRDGKGTGGQVDTAGYALLTLELGGYRPDE